MRVAKRGVVLDVDLDGDLRAAEADALDAGPWRDDVLRAGDVRDRDPGRRARKQRENPGDPPGGKTTCRK